MISPMLPVVHGAPGELTYMQHLEQGEVRRRNGTNGSIYVAVSSGGLMVLDAPPLRAPAVCDPEEVLQLVARLDQEGYTKPAADLRSLVQIASEIAARDPAQAALDYLLSRPLPEGPST